MKKVLKKLFKKLQNSKIADLLKYVYDAFVLVEYFFINLKCFVKGGRMPSDEDRKLIADNVTFIFKSFERQSMARRLVRNILKYYPDVRIVIADDSRNPLVINRPNVEIINLPFNSGLSVGIAAALNIVTTPFVIRVDDDELLTLKSNFHKQLRFLKQHPEVDLIGIQACSAPFPKSPEKSAKDYFRFTMDYAFKPLIIPHMTQLDETHLVVGKTANIFVAKTDCIKKIGYDPKIRMLDHNDFFMRAAGNIVSVMDTSAFVFHYHNLFDRNYSKYRMDLEGDREYIRKKNIMLWNLRNSQQ